MQNACKAIIALQFQYRSLCN